MKPASIKFFLLLLTAAVSGIACGACSARADQTVSRDFSFTKRSRNFDQKNAFPVMPISSDTRIKRLKGFVFAITRPQDPVTRFPWSETLFGATLSTNGLCPKDGQGVGDIFAQFNAAALGGTILKQISFGTKVFHFDYVFEKPVQISVAQGSCLFVNFDGSDLVNGPYTMGEHIEVTYDESGAVPPPEKVKVTGLDAEFLLGVHTLLKPTLNAYVAVPVHPDGPMAPGTKLVGLFGNASVSAVMGNRSSYHTTGKWTITHNVMVYTNNSCQKAFRNHLPKTFTWNDPTGFGNVPNPTSARWPDSILLGQIVFSGTGDVSLSQPIVENKNRFPYTVHDGDCVVDAVIPQGDMADSRPFNTESQINVETILP